MTIDPLSPVLLLAEGLYIAVSVGLLVLSKTFKSEWVKASVAGFAIATLAWRLLAVVPSWWLYYAESNMGWGGQGCVEIVIGDLFDTDSDTFSCLKQTLKDTVVVIQNAVVLAAFIVAFLIYQRKFPKQLAPGEAKPEATGGYK